MCTQGRGAPDKRDSYIAPSDTLFVVNFNPDKTDDKDIEDFFGKLRPKHIEIFPKWAFVTMYSVDDAKEAVFRAFLASPLHQHIVWKGKRGSWKRFWIEINDLKSFFPHFEISPHQICSLGNFPEGIFMFI